MVCRFRYFPTYVQCEPYDVMSCHTCILLLPYLTCLPYLVLPTTLVGSMLLHGLFCSFLLLSVEVSAQVSSFSSFELYVLLQPPIGDLTILIPCLLDPPFLAQFISCPLLLFASDHLDQLLVWAQLASGSSYFWRQFPFAVCLVQTTWIRLQFRRNQLLDPLIFGGSFLLRHVGA